MNADQQQAENLAGQVVRVTQILCVSLIAGVVIFGGFTVLQVMNAQPQPGAQKQEVLWIVGLIAFAMTILAYFFTSAYVGRPSRHARAKLRELANLPREEAKVAATEVLTGPYQINKFIPAAILEGGAFINLVAFYLEYRLVNLAAVVVLLVFMILSFPSRSQFDAHVEKALQQAETDFMSYGNGS